MTFVRTIYNEIFYIDETIPDNTMESNHSSAISVRDGKYEYYIAKSKIVQTAKSIDELLYQCMCANCEKSHHCHNSCTNCEEYEQELETLTNELQPKEDK